jgi:hypothetical protein
MRVMTVEHQRLIDNAKKSVPLVKWGPYLSERQWATVREDYSADGDAWHYFPFDHAHCRAYRWGEDGIAGISDYFQNLCFSVGLWNGKDSILKERLFGLGNFEGNHGEDVKELYYYLDNVPTHTYMEYLYKYPQQEFPYELLRNENRIRTKFEPEYEILDTHVFDNDQYFDVLISYAKNDDEDICIKINIHNRYSEAANITVLPTLWFYNRWAFTENFIKPAINFVNRDCVQTTHLRLGNHYLYFLGANDRWFTENETNTEIVTGEANKDIFTKDAFHAAAIKRKNVTALRNKKAGTKFAAVYRLNIAAGETKTIYCRFSNNLKNTQTGSRRLLCSYFTKGFKQRFGKYSAASNCRFVVE